LFLPKAFLHPIITLFSIPTLYHISRNLKRFFTKNLTADFNFVSGLNHPSNGWFCVTKDERWM
ncbi:MAG: hypothetical protein SOX82_07215, partial [Eubacteriales bacterium]|nr:hypothetical protein [Eubacteriales bacterium]MDY4213457.1 hypothetical protein [Eubacteriales bacterium]